MEATTIIFSALLLLAASIFSYFHISTTSKSRTPPLPPGPRGLPIVGYLPFLDVNLHHQLTKLGHKYGPIYSLKLGSKLYIVVSSPTLVKAVVRDHDAVFANRDPPAAAMAAHGGMDIFWSPNGAYWRDMRKLFVREMLSNKNLEGSYELRVGEVNKFVADLRGKIGDAVEIGELVFGIEVGVLMSMLWGGTVRGEERDRIGAEFRVKVSKFVDLLGRPNVSDFFPFLGRFDLQGIEREMKGVVPKIEELIDVIIDEKMKVMKSGDERKKDLLEVLLELKGQKVGEESSFGLFQIKAVLMKMIYRYSIQYLQYLPFGSGRRVCPGLALAERMVLYLLATLLHSFDWRLPDGESIDLSGTFGIVVRKTKPLLVVPYQRSR